MVHLITYDLKAPNDKSSDYERVIGHIKASYPNWAHIEKSVWLVSTTQSSSQVRDQIKAALHADDALFVAKITDWATWNISMDVINWLKNNL